MIRAMAFKAVALTILSRSPELKGSAHAQLAFDMTFLSAARVQARALISVAARD